MSFFIRKILIKKSQEELGFSLGGQGPCVVSAVTLGGLADQAQLRCGDEILEVNFVNVTQMSYEIVSKNILRKAAIGNVVLNVRTLYFQNVIGGHCPSQDRMISSSPAYSLRRTHFKYWSTSSTRTEEHTVDSENNISKPVETTYLPNLFGVRTTKASNERRLINCFERFDYNVFAFYTCSKEIRRNDNIAASSLDCLRSCVVLLKKKETKHNSLILFGINREGISLLNAFGKDITIYPLKNIVFSAVCSEDRNYFGFVCKSVLTCDEGTEATSRYDCHVFMIDKNICKHENHKKFAALLELPCLQDEDCQLFPSTSSQILKELNAIYEKRRGESVNGDTRKPLLLTVSSPAIHRKRDMRKLMTSPPSSLVALDAREKEELIKGLTSSPFTRSLTRKPPVPHKVASDGSLSRKNGGFGSLFQRGRRKSEGIFKSSGDLTANKMQDVPAKSPLFSPKRDTNENLKRLSLASSASESSINKSLHLVESWSIAFENLLGDPIGLRCFQEFLKKEFSEENIQFWIACEEFKKIKNLEKMKVEADTIFKQYLSPSASSLVNVNQNGLKNVEEHLQSPHSEIFSAPQDQVFHLMKFDSYNRFLKSDLYKECLEAERSEKRIPFDEENHGRKSKSPYQDGNGDWKKQILNFLSKGGKRSDLKTLRKEFTIGESKDQDETIPDNFVRHNSLKDDQLWDGLHSQSKGNFLRIFFPDGTSRIIVVENGVTLKDTLSDVCKSKQISLNSFDVTMGCPRKIASLDQEIAKLSDNVVYLEKRILFRFDLPNGRSVGIKANPNKTLRDILQPVLKRNGFDMNDYSFHIVNSKHSIPLGASISVVENKRLQSRKLHKKLEKQISDSATLKHSGDLRSSLRRLRTSSFNREEKVKPEMKREDESAPRTFGNEMKHILLGKTKSNEDGATALMSVLQRSQSSRMDDQRGLLPSDLELPDFLKSPPPTPATTYSEPDVLPSPRGSMNSITCSPSKSIPCPPSPLIIDKFSTRYSYDLTRSPQLARSMNSGLFSVTSWKEVESPDRELVDKSYTNTLSSDGYDTQSKPSLLELSRSDLSLSKDTVRKNSGTLDSKKNTDSNQSSREQLNQSMDIDNDAFDLLGVHEVTPIVTNGTIKSSQKHATRLGSIDLINYDLSPRETTARRILDPFEENEIEPVFLHNAIPTPEKPKLLKGETILGRKNEKITYV